MGALQKSQTQVVRTSCSDSEGQQSVRVLTVKCKEFVTAAVYCLARYQYLIASFFGCIGLL